MQFINDTLFIFLSSLIFYKSYKKIVFNKKASSAFYVIAVIYFFCCFPVLLDHLLGPTKYDVIYWYKPFLPAMRNEYVCIIYNIYIISSIFFLYTYGLLSTKKLNYQLIETSKNINQFLYWIGMVYPLVFLCLFNDITQFLTYDSLIARGLYGMDIFMLNSFILLSLYCTCVLTMVGAINKQKIFITILLFILLIWLQGKRFIVANMLLFAFFFITKSNIDLTKRKKLFKLLPMAFTGLILFSALYLAYVKPLDDMSFQSVYDMLRVDFGRDDVIKYVIYQEFFVDNPILDYRGESFLSTLFVFIPKSIWVNKPYTHYEYLTASIKSLPVNNIGSGITPSLFEMCLCNFGILGFIFSTFILLLLCKLCDNMKTINSKSLVLMYIVVLLTQNTDVYIIYFFLIIYNCIFKYIKTRNINLKF